jgi:hypothetical protein
MSKTAVSTSRSKVAGVVLVGTAAIAMIMFAVVLRGFRNATAPPLVRHLRIEIRTYPSGWRATRIVLFSDLHVHGPDMPPARLRRLVDQINALHPDIDVAAGDFIGNNWIGATYSIDEAIMPLARLKARLGVYAVLGNNDYDAGGRTIAHALRQAGVHVLANDARKVGPVALGGLDGRILPPGPWASSRQRTYEALGRTPGIRVLVAHRPDEVRWAPPTVQVVLAGHTHCGQIVLPLIGPIETGSDFGRKYLCGMVRDGSKILVVTGGLGTSHLPLRIGAPPDIWVIDLAPPHFRGP